MGFIKNVDYKNRFLAVLVIAIGVSLALMMSLSLKYVIDLLVEHKHDIELFHFAEDMRSQYEKTTRFLGPLSGRISLGEEPQQDDIKAAFEGARDLVEEMQSQSNMLAFALVPRWVGQFAQSDTDIVVKSRKQQTHIYEFITRNLTDWSYHLSRSGVGQTVILGFDRYDSQEINALVIGYPLFEEGVSLQNAGPIGPLPVGFAVAWVDLNGFLTNSFSPSIRDQIHLIFCLKSGTSTRSCIDYEKQGVKAIDPQVLQDAPLHFHNYRFHWAGREASLSYGQTHDQVVSGWGRLHLFVGAIGIFASFILGFLILRAGRKETPGLFDRPIEVSSSPSPAKNTPQVERLMRTNKARLDYMMGNLPIALFAIDEMGSFIWAEGQGLRIIGAQDQALEGQSAHRFFSQNEKIITAIEACLKGQEQHDVFAIKGNWVDIRLSPVQKTNSGFQGLIGMASDVSTEYRVREHLDKANLHLQGLLDNLPLGVAFIRDGVCEWCSRLMEQTLGYEEDELNGRSPELIYADPEKFEDVRSRARIKLVKGKPFSDRVHCRRKDGSRFMAEMTGTIVDPENLQAGSLWIIQDLTDHIREEQEKKLSRTVYDNLIEGIIVSNADNKITSVNKAFSLITGYAAEEVIGRNPNVLSSGRHEPEFFKKMWQEIQVKGFWRGEFWNRRKNGDTYLQNAMLSSVKDETGDIQEYVAVFSDITRDRQNQEQLIYQANYDILTGLPNRHLLADRFQQAVAWAKREDTCFAVVYLDLDNFKYHNESFGHESGDFILKTMADRISANIREFDTVARIGGDEFVLLLMGTEDQGEITRSIAKISFDLSHPITLTNQSEDEIFLSATCGIAQYPKDGDSFGELSRKADAALYNAKETERGIFMFFTEEMNKRAHERIKMENRLRKALENEEFVLFYQPKVDLVSGEIHGAESLIRWIDPDEGMIGPDRFIPIAEETGLIVPIGEWVFRTACQQMKVWQDKGLNIQNLAINLSGRQFLKPDLVDGMLNTITQVGIDPTLLELEITESFIANSEQTTTDALERLSAIGVKLSVDDFGTGYSSLSYLHRFPLDLMKIDRSFIIEIEDEAYQDEGKIAKAVIAIAKSMNLSIVGEGVENEHQLQFLKENGCHLIQGYYFSKPLPGEAFEELVQSGKTLFSEGP